MTHQGQDHAQEGVDPDHDQREVVRAKIKGAPANAAGQGLIGEDRDPDPDPGRNAAVQGAGEIAEVGQLIEKVGLAETDPDLGEGTVAAIAQRRKSIGFMCQVCTPA